MQLSIFLIELIPVLSGLVVIPLLPLMYTLSLNFYFERYLAFAAPFIFWSLLRLSIISYQFHNLAENTRGKILFGFFIAVLLPLFFFSLQYFRPRFEDLPFYAVLFLLGLAAISDTLLYKFRFIAAVALSFVYACLVSYLSTLVISGIWWWQTAVISLGIGCLVASVKVAQVLTSLVSARLTPELKTQRTRIYPPSIKLERLLGGLFPFLVCLGLTCIAALAMFQYIPQRYLAVYALLPLAARQLTQLRQLRDQAVLPKNFFREASGLCFLFAVMLVLLGIA